MSAFVKAFHYLADTLDNPDIPYKQIIVFFILYQFTLERYLSYRQYVKVASSSKVPRELNEVVDQDTFIKSKEYSLAKNRYSFAQETFGLVTSLWMVYADIYVYAWDKTASLPPSLLGEIPRSLIMGYVLSLFSTIISIPFDLYYTFVLEEKYGFNKNTFKQYTKDFFISQSLMVVLGAPVGYAFLKIILYFGKSFALYLYIFMFTFQILMIAIYPTIIQPLFNKLTPLEPGPVKENVEALSSKLSFPLKHLYKIDGSKRSAHSNAYFYGLPWSKHIVLYDTLLDKTTTDEITAVLAHELGHWKLNHMTKILTITQLHLLFIFGLFTSFFENKAMYNSFGFHKEYPVLVGFLLFNALLPPMESLMQLAMNTLTRRFEYQADAFAVAQNYADSLAKALIKLQIQNLSTMEADWMYSAYHYNHPILTERLNAIGWKGGKVDLPEDVKIKKEE